MNVTSGFEIFDDDGATASDHNAVACVGLTKRFGRVLALDALDWTVPEGSVCGVLGPNGSGKTTLLSLLCGHTRPTAGSVELLGDAPPAALPRVGSLIGEPIFWPHMSVLENMKMAAAIAGVHDDEAEALAQVAGFDDPSLRRRKFRDCSTGMRQRLGVVACLLGDPDLVILDEPTNGLDPQGIVGIRNLVRRMCVRADGTRRTVIMASHLLREVELLCDRVCVLSAGRALYSGVASGVSTRVSAARVETTDDERAAALLAEAGVQCAFDPAGGFTASGFADLGGLGWLSKLLADGGVYPTLLVPGRSLESDFLQLMETGGLLE